MQITEILAKMGGLQSIARELGVSESQAASGADALAPAILGGFKKQVAAQPTGVEGLEGMLGQLGGESLADDVLSPNATNVTKGNDLLGHIFGSKDVSRAVAENASTRSGLDPALLKKMLPMVAMLVAGYMAKQRMGGGGTGAGMGGGLGGMLGGMLGGGGTGGGTGGGGLGGALGGALGGGGGAGRGGLAGMLDMDGDGNPLDDIMRMMGRK